jgi:hypothetical protein
MDNYLAYYDTGLITAMLLFQLESSPTNAYQNNDNKVLKATMKYRHDT